MGRSDSVSAMCAVGPSDSATHLGARRQHKRWAFDAEVEMLAPNRSRGYAINASQGGMLFTLEAPVDVGTVMGLRVTTPERHTSFERARVVWRRTRQDGCLVGAVFVQNEA